MQSQKPPAEKDIKEETKDPEPFDSLNNQLSDLSLGEPTFQEEPCLFNPTKFKMKERMTMFPKNYRDDDHAREFLKDDFAIHRLNPYGYTIDSGYEDRVMEGMLDAIEEVEREIENFKKGKK